MSIYTYFQLIKWLYLTHTFQLDVEMFLSNLNLELRENCLYPTVKSNTQNRNIIFKKKQQCND